MNPPIALRPLISKGVFNDRDQFGKFLNRRGLTGDGVEIGTHRGEFADKLLRTWRGTLYCVDHWQSYDNTDPASQGNRKADREATSLVADKYPKRMQIIEAESLVAAGIVTDGTLDFVYEDANHQYEPTLQNLRAWWPKLRPGGILAGHDIICPGELNGGWEQTVQHAVFDFAREVDRTIYLVVETQSLPWSYYLEK